MGELPPVEPARPQGEQAVDSPVSDEVLRTRVRKLVEERRPDPAWERLTKHPLVAVIVGFALTWGVGTLLTGQLKAAQLANSRALEADRARAEALTRSSGDLARLIYERRAHAVLLTEALRQRAPREELTILKRTLDAGYATTYRDYGVLVVTIRSLVPGPEFDFLLGQFAKVFSEPFAEIESKLREKYYATVGQTDTLRQAPDPDLDAIQFRLIEILACTTVYSELLWTLASRDASGERKHGNRDTVKARMAQCTNAVRH